MHRHRRSPRQRQSRRHVEAFLAAAAEAGSTDRRRRPCCNKTSTEREPSDATRSAFVKDQFVEGADRADHPGSSRCNDDDMAILASQEPLSEQVTVLIRQPHPTPCHTHAYDYYHHHQQLYETRPRCSSPATRKFIKEMAPARETARARRSARQRSPPSGAMWRRSHGNAARPNRPGSTHRNEETLNWGADILQRRRQELLCRSKPSRQSQETESNPQFIARVRIRTAV